MKNSHLAFIADALASVTPLAQTNFGRVKSISIKGDDPNQVLTETDIEVGKRLVAAVKDQFPEHNIIDEEAGVIDNHSNFTWVIDPIDGTSNFASGVPTYGIMIGLLEDDRPVAGGIALPSLGDLFLGATDTPANRNGDTIHVTDAPSLLGTLVAYGLDGNQSEPEHTHREAEFIGRLVLAIRNLRTSNSCFDTALVAAGAYGGFLNQTSKIWDNVAQQAIIEAAGGRYTDFWGRPMDYTNPVTKAEQNYTFCCAPTHLHVELQSLIAS